MAGIIAIGAIGNKISVIYFDKVAFYNFFGNLMAAFALGVDQPLIILIVLEKMAGKTRFRVDLKVLLPFKVTMTGGAGDFYAVNFLR